MIINTNRSVFSLYGNTSSTVDTKIERLSSGVRINSVADAATGLKIASSLRDRVTLSSDTPSSIPNTYGPSGKVNQGQTNQAVDSATQARLNEPSLEIPSSKNLGPTQGEQFAFEASNLSQPQISQDAGQKILDQVQLSAQVLKDTGQKILDQAQLSAQAVMQLLNRPPQ